MNLQKHYRAKHVDKAKKFFSKADVLISTFTDVLLVPLGSLN